MSRSVGIMHKDAHAHTRGTPCSAPMFLLPVSPFSTGWVEKKCCNVPKKRQGRRLEASKRRHTIHWLLKMLHFNIQVALERVPLLQPHLSMRFISWSPSPLRKRSRLAGSIRQEQRASKRFSIISCSSAVDGLWRLNTWEGRRRREHLERTQRRIKEWGCYFPL